MRSKWVSRGLNTGPAGSASIASALRDAGAQPSTVSKSVRSGRRAGDPPDVPIILPPAADAPAVDALQYIFARHVNGLLEADVAVRRGLPDSAHRLHVEYRRLFNILKTFAPILDPDTVAFLYDELSWVSAELGEVRNAEIQSARLSAMTKDPAAGEFIAQSLDARAQAMRSGALAALRSDRHGFLLEDLIIMVAEPPVTAPPPALELGIVEDRARVRDASRGLELEALCAGHQGPKGRRRRARRRRGWQGRRRRRWRRRRRRGRRRGRR